MAAKKKGTPKIMLFLICMVIALSVILTSVSLLMKSSDYFANEAKNAAKEHTAVTADAITSGAADSYVDVEAIAKDASGLHGFETIDAYGNSAVKKYKFNCLQFVLGDGVEYRYGESVGDFSSDEVQAIIHSKETRSSNMFDDLSLGSSCIAIYSPVSGNDEIDGVLAYKATTSVFRGTKHIHEATVFYALCEMDGKMLESYVADGFKKDVSHNAFTYLYNISKTKDEFDAIKADTKKGISTALELTVDGEIYVVSTAPLLSSGTEFIVVCVYPEKTLSSQQYSLYDKLLGATGLLIMVTVVTIISSILIKRINERKVTIIDELDPQLGCNSFNKFVQEAQLITERNRFSKFAVCYTSIKNYDYLVESCSAELIDETLNHISNVLRKSLSENETYGRIVDDRFVFMIHYTDVTNLADKLKIMTALISYFDKMKDSGYAFTMATGVAIARVLNVNNENEYVAVDINDCVNKAKIASIAHTKAYEKPFIIYDSSISSAYAEDAIVESRMREALKNREFRLFFQPKYNISSNSLDSAEVLVRWYNEESKTYQSPASFIRIFETNGFIIELDHYVFRETCVFLQQMKESGQKTVPLSINVSRVTAIDPGFVEFYKNTREEFGIPERYLTLEFTETFAYDSYKTLSELVLELKKSGFLSSIDDFGVGYSALNILKELPVDEVKMDKDLLSPGNDPNKDRVILEGMFKMTNGLGLKLIQEGVETKEELDYIHQLGCNIIQGYYYSKPLFMTDFIDFINDSTLNKLYRS